MCIKRTDLDGEVVEGVPVCDLLELLREELVHVLVGAPDVLGPRRDDDLLKC